MQNVFIEYVFLILIILGLVMLADKLRVAYPIVLVLGGLALSFTNQFTNIKISPELVFFIFLPPLLYEAAWEVSWKQLWKWRRVITSFAFPIVILTSCVVAFASHAMIPGFTLALGFLLGGIVSPPDAVSAINIMRRVRAPKSILSIVEGESLMNDASSLIVFRFALAAVITGQFHLGKAAWEFLLVIVVGALIGIAVGLAFYAIHRWLPTTSGIDTALTLITPYCMYYAAEHFHFSGVLAVVSGGLFLFTKRQIMLSYQSRIQGENVWSSLVFVFNGVIFILIGLQLPAIMRGLDGVSLSTAIGYGVAISVVLIITRLICTFGSALLSRIMSRVITVADPNPGWKAPLILGLSGMRGVVSLAMALSIPLLLSEGQPFPYRNLILFITFVVILITLVLQGLNLPWILKKVDIKDKFTPMPEREQELVIQKKLAQSSLVMLKGKYAKERKQNKHLDNLYARLQIDLHYFEKNLREFKDSETSVTVYQRVYLDLLERQRNLLNEMNRESEFDEGLINKYLALIDLEEYKIHERIIEE